ncbi:hypothetical protein PV783_16910 [Chitinophaga sp. CC14]|uniref:hypothetical protein n=1 Tax=Chitinophaga sp. CC14 TaxID=3029199 RepID=UPI003B77195B
MEMITIINHFNKHHDIPTADIAWMTSNKRQVYDYLLLYPHRDFTIALLDSLVDLRKAQPDKTGIEDIMFACLLVTLHRQIEDCLLIWKAKNIDFDTFCGVDIQLVPFMGVPATISYLQASSDPDAPKALEYILECDEAADFEQLDHYFSSVDLHWWMNCTSL